MLMSLPSHQTASGGFTGCIRTRSWTRISNPASKCRWISMRSNPIIPTSFLDYILTNPYLIVKIANHIIKIKRKAEMPIKQQKHLITKTQNVKTRMNKNNSKVKWIRIYYLSLSFWDDPQHSRKGRMPKVKNAKIQSSIKKAETHA